MVYPRQIKYNIYKTYNKANVATDKATHKNKTQNPHTKSFWINIFVGLFLILLLFYFVFMYHQRRKKYSHWAAPT